MQTKDFFQDDKLFGGHLNDSGEEENEITGGDGGEHDYVEVDSMGLLQNTLMLG